MDIRLLRVAATAAGEVFLRHARSILRQLDEAAEHARRASRGEDGHLDIGYSTTATYLVMPEALRASRERAPAVDVRLHELPSSAQLSALAERRLDIGFVAVPTAVPEGVEVDEVASDALLVALPEGHRLAARRAIAPTELAGEPMVTVRRDIEPIWSDACAAWMAAHGAAVRVVSEPDSKLAVLGLVAAGLGVTVVTTSLASVRREGVVFRPFKIATLRLGLGLALARPASPAATLFQEVVSRARGRRRGGARSSYGSARS